MFINLQNCWDSKNAIPKLLFDIIVKLNIKLTIKPEKNAVTTELDRTTSNDNVDWAVFWAWSKAYNIVLPSSEQFAV